MRQSLKSLSASALLLDRKWLAVWLWDLIGIIKDAVYFSYESLLVCGSCVKWISQAAVQLEALLNFIHRRVALSTCD